MHPKEREVGLIWLAKVCKLKHHVHALLGECTPVTRAKQVDSSLRKKKMVLLYLQFTVSHCPFLTTVFSFARTQATTRAITKAKSCMLGKI